MNLTPKQRAFADFYIELGNATEAARRAGYSAKTAKSIGAENLTKPDIKIVEKFCCKNYRKHFLLSDHESENFPARI